MKNRFLNDIKFDEILNRQDFITVEETLSLPMIEGYQVLGGGKGLKNKCKHITVLETPDGMDWLEGGEFLLTAGYAFIGKEEIKEKLVENIHKKGAAAIAIKDKRYFGNISEKLIEDADKYGIPLILISYNAVYSDLISSFYYLLFYKKNEYILNLNNFYKKFLNLSFVDKNYDEILFSLSSLSNSNTFLFDNNMNLISQSIINLNSYEKISLFKQFNKDGQGQSLFFKVENCINKKVNDTFISIYPIIKNNKNAAYIFIVKEKKIDDIEQDIIKYGVSLISFWIENEKLNMGQPRFKTTLVEIMLNNKELPFEFYDNIEKDIGWDKDGDIVGLCIKLGSKNINSTEDFNDIIHNVFTEIKGLDNFLETNRNNYIFVILKLESEDNLEEALNNIYGKINNSIKKHKVSIGVSNAYKYLKDINKLHDESYLAVLFSNYDIVYFNSLDTIKLLFPLKDDEEIKRYYEKTIKKLEVYDITHDSNLVETIEAYFRYNMNSKLTASKLFIHVETLRYRLSRIEEITGYSTNETEGIFALQMGLKLTRLLRLK